MSLEPGAAATALNPRPAGTAAGAAAFVLAVLSALATPLMGLPDEPAHVVHAVAVVHGQVAGEDEVRTSPEDGWTRTETVVEVPAAYAALPALPTCYVFRPEVPADCAPAVDAVAGSPTTSSSTVGTYAPAWYAAVGWPARLVPPTAALYGMRLVQAVLFGALLAVAAVGLVRAGGRRWAFAGLALAVPPIAVHVAGGVNPSGTEIAAGVALWATSAALLTGARTRGDLVRWLGAALVLAVARPLGPLLAVGVPVVAWALLGRRDGASGWRDLVPAWAVAVLGLVAGTAMGWSLWRGTLSAFSGIPAADLGVLDVLRQSLGLVPERLDQMVGVLGWADVVLPRWVVGGWYAALAVVLVAALRAGDRRARTWLVLLGIATLLVPVAADLRSADQIGLVWQGRYTLPLAAGLPVLGGLLADRGGHRIPGWVSTAIVGVAAVAHLVALWAVLRRFRLGVDGSLVDVLGTAGVTGGAPGWALLGCALSAGVGVLWAHTKGQGGPVGEPSVRR